MINIGEPKNGFSIPFLGLTIYIGQYEFTLFQVSKKATKKILLPAELVIRESCKPFAGG